jgi:hypothetical protein
LEAGVSRMTVKMGRPVAFRIELKEVADDGAYAVS